MQIGDLKDMKFRFMGTIALATNVKEKKTSKEIHEIYKERELIEDTNDAYKNVMSKNASYLQSMNSYYGWLFINQITLLLYYCVYSKIKEKEITSKSSGVRMSSSIRNELQFRRLQKKNIVEIGTKVEYARLRDIFDDLISPNKY